MVAYGVGRACVDIIHLGVRPESAVETRQMSEGRWCGGLWFSAPGRSTEREKAGDGSWCMTAWDGAGETRVPPNGTRAVGSVVSRGQRAVCVLASASGESEMQNRRRDGRARLINKYLRSQEESGVWVRGVEVQQGRSDGLASSLYLEQPEEAVGHRLDSFSAGLQQVCRRAGVRNFAIGWCTP